MNLPADRFLWLGILRAETELAAIEHRGLCKGSQTPSGGETPPCRFLTSLAQPLPKSFEELIAQMGDMKIAGRKVSSVMRVTGLSINFARCDHQFFLGISHLWQISSTTTGYFLKIAIRLKTYSSKPPDTSWYYGKNVSR